MRDMQLSKNFKRSEFACKGAHCCGGSAPIDMRLIVLLQAIRDAVQSPITVSSGFRCRTHNFRTPTAHPESYHTIGIAADIHARYPILSPDLFLAAERVIAELGYGYPLLYQDKGIVHVDIRNA
jgi:zinc D-Ala-D-Ala carboxypeptidase